ncbi:MAG: tetratricopeptide repeat protein, partial [Nanoarchaeota archaeon]
MENIIVRNKKELEEKIKKFSDSGKNNLHVISDFDRTLTNAFVNGEGVPSLISVLRNGNYLTQDYSRKAHALHDKYYPIEINPNNYTSWFRKGLVLKKLNKYEEAINAYNKAIEIDPNFKDVYNSK